MICPYCRSDYCRRSRRRGTSDYLISVFNLRPWRCRVCEERFFAWAVPLKFARFVHCPRCGSFDLRRHIPHDRINHGNLRWLKHLTGAHAYRCDACRLCFYSYRTYRKILPLPGEPPAAQPAQAETAQQA